MLPRMRKWRLQVLKITIMDMKMTLSSRQPVSSIAHSNRQPASTYLLPEGGRRQGRSLKIRRTSSEVAGRAELLIKILCKARRRSLPPHRWANPCHKPFTSTNSYRGTATIWGHLGSPNATPKRHLESCWSPLGPKSGHHEPKYVQKGHLELHWGSLTSENTVKHIGISLFS